MQHLIGYNSKADMRVFFQDLRKGFTTGTAAAAATKAAIFLMNGQELSEVSVTLLNGKQITIRVHRLGCMESEKFFAEVIKDGGDDPDVTNHAIIRAVVQQQAEGICIDGGQGVGRITKAGLPVPIGEAAINPVPRRMIFQAITESPIKNGLKVMIEVPAGVELAAKTLNPRLGILGGISILGTTGIVEPMSEESWREALTSQLHVIRATGFHTVILTPGRQGFQWAINKGLPAEQIAEMSNFVGFILNQCSELDFHKVLLWGHFGKLIKIAAGCFHTHSRYSDGRLETLTAITAIYGGNRSLLNRIFQSNTTEEAIGYLQEENLDRAVLDQAAARASQRSMEMNSKLLIGCVLLDRQGRIRGIDQNANRIIEAEAWQIDG